MLTVLKRSGLREPFNAEKIRNTIAAASDEIGEPMSSGDLRNATEMVYRKLSGQENVTSRHVYDAVIEALRAQGFEDVARAYAGDVGNHWNTMQGKEALV